MTGRKGCQITSAFYKETFGATGAVVDGIPIICGGYIDKVDYEDKCYKLKFNSDEKKVWWSYFISMQHGRYEAASVAVGKELWVLGGLSVGHQALKATEYVHIDGTITPGTDLPFPVLGLAIVALNDDFYPYTFIIVGGYTPGSNVDHTFFYKSDGEHNGTWTEGPQLKQPRRFHVAGLQIDSVSRKSYIVVAGGSNIKQQAGHPPTEGDYLKSVEILSPDGSIQNGKFDSSLAHWTIGIGTYQNNHTYLKKCLLLLRKINLIFSFFKMPMTSLTICYSDEIVPYTYGNDGGDQWTDEELVKHGKITAIQLKIYEITDWEEPSIISAIRTR